MAILQSIKIGENFSSIYEYESFLQNLKAAEHSGKIEQIPVSATREVAQIERWYREVETGDVYSLLPPEFPAKGYWGPVPLKDFQFSERVQ